MSVAARRRAAKRIELRYGKPHLGKAEADKKAKPKGKKG